MPSRTPSVEDVDETSSTSSPPIPSSSSIDEKCAAPNPTLGHLGKITSLAGQSPNDIDGVPVLPGDVPPEDASFDQAQIPLRYRLLAFSMIIFFSTGSSYYENVLSPLKSTLLKELKINNAQYGAVSSASNLINTILPIIGGIGMDYWGATYAAIISSVFITVGAVVGAAAANTNHYQLLIGGLIIMGFGSTIIESTQSKLYAHWFSGGQLAFIFGVDVAWGRVVNIICKSTAVPLSEINGWWGWALWIPTIVTALNLALVLLYWAYERNVPRQYRPKLGREARDKEKWDRRKFAFRSLLQLPKFFWILCGTQIFQNSAVSVYTSNLADIQTATRGTSKLAAGYNSSLQSVIPIVLTPIVGLFFDRFGWRMIFVSATAALYVVVFVLIGLTKVHPLAPILISSFALSSNALTFIAAIPVLVGDDSLLGTAFGVWKSFQNVNTTILEVAAGAIQDRSGGSYNNVIYLIVAIKSLEVVWGPVYDFLDGRWLAHSLRLPEKERLALRREAKERGEPYSGWHVSKKVRCTVMGQLGAMIVVAWVVYIVYSLGT
ncbi:hypothetical protein JCM24511_07241 [Saitozyma sp. JCM 24511]|nr:hypothetical protein JCM24511_07241 [Saitozyma sp. JCM 24511]